MSASEHDQVRDLLAAWSLDACSVDEEALVEAHLLGCAECATEAAQLREVAGALGSQVAATPPPGLRAAVLAAARAYGRTGRPALPAAVTPYAAEVHKLDGLLGGLTPELWRATTVVHRWSVRELVAHLALVDGLLAAQLGAPVAATGKQHPGATRAAWRAQADGIIDRASRIGSELADRTVDVAGLALPLDLQLLGRAFETWMHADDIRQSVGVPLDPPIPEHVNLLAGAALRLLPAALARAGRDRPGHSARLVLTGDGGGEWVLSLGGSGAGGEPAKPAEPAEPAVTVELDLLEFCYLVGGRRDPAQVTCDVSGDPRLATDLLTVAATFDRD